MKQEINSDESNERVVVIPEANIPPDPPLSLFVCGAQHLMKVEPEIVSSLIPLTYNAPPLYNCSASGCSYEVELQLVNVQPVIIREIPLVYQEIAPAGSDRHPSHEQEMNAYERAESKIICSEPNCFSIQLVVQSAFL